MFRWVYHAPNHYSISPYIHFPGADRSHADSWVDADSDSDGDLDRRRQSQVWLQDKNGEEGQVDVDEAHCETCLLRATDRVLLHSFLPLTLSCSPTAPPITLAFSVSPNPI